jgi:hypothetical protein
VSRGSAGTLAKLCPTVSEPPREPPPPMTAKREVRELLDRELCASKSARGKNASALPYKLSKQAGLGIECLDLFYECSSHRLHSIENLFCSVLDS